MGPRVGNEFTEPEGGQRRLRATYSDTGRQARKDGRHAMVEILERFVRALTTNETFRRAALRDPARSATRFGLVGAERAGAIALCARYAGGDAPMRATSTGTTVIQPEVWWI